MLGVDEGKVNAHWHSGSGQTNHNRHIEFRMYFFTSLAPYFSRNFSTTDFTASASVMETARNSASAPRPSIRIDGFLSTFSYHCVSDPFTCRRDSFSPSSTTQIGIGDRLPGLPSDHAELDLAVAARRSLRSLFFGAGVRHLKKRAGEIPLSLQIMELPEPNPSTRLV
jgi:hypothetical protein